MPTTVFRADLLMAPDEALEAFSKVAPRQAKVVELRYFGGLTEEEIVEVLKISPRTVRRDWEFAKSWLMREMPCIIADSETPSSTPKTAGLS
jgi:DNA-directed RNA polymerase specialized sigma24 family protein